ncbi:MAG: peptidoglycan/xylan/chitin deacetylase (PgdA/CDA1 family) [Gammaproteobacteria bacterium]|jgi:peptidoglycan/xylan/chitin deacetylase (PgdA/CDA1 family)
MINAFLSKYKTAQLALGSIIILGLGFSTDAAQADMPESVIEGSQKSVVVLAQGKQGLIATKEVSLAARSTQNSFVVLMYHHVSSQTPRSTSVSPEEFEKHMAYLSEYHSVISLEAALDGLNNPNSLPERAVVITFDDGFKNILENGHPIMRKYKFEYTIFINPAQIDLSNTQLSWKEVKKMSKEGVTFANHTLDHLHLLDRHPNENKLNWLARVKQNINVAEEKLSAQLGYSKKWLAYPFGEFDSDLKAMLKEMSYIGLGQHSGGVGKFSDMQSLPRFPAAGRYANLDTLRTKINSLAMPVTAVRPHRYVMGIEETIGEVQIDVLLDDIRFNRIACFFDADSLPVTQTENGFSINIKNPFYPGRTRVNCTAPSVEQSDRFYWYSIPFFTPKQNGTYLD